MSLCRPEVKLISQFQLVPAHFCYQDPVLHAEVEDRGVFQTQILWNIVQYQCRNGYTY